MIGEKIKQRRMEIGISAEELADRIGKSRATVYRYENGDIEDIPITIIKPLAKALKTTPAYLMNLEQCKSQDKLKKIVELLDGKGAILVRNAHEYEGGKWYVHCWLERIEKDPEDIFCRHISINEKDIYNQYIADLDSALDEIIKKLESLNLEREI